MEDASTVEREWLYVTPHSHSPTHYRDVSLFVFPIRENTATAILPRARAVDRSIFFSLRTCCSTFHIWQCTEALLYEKWYFHGRHKNCICIADADDLDFPTDSLDIIQILWIFGYSLVLELVISLYTLSNEDVWHHRHRSHRDNSSHFRPKFDRLRSA